MAKPAISLPPTCPYCQRPAAFLVTSEKLYHGYDYGPAWACEPCGAWVGCHKGTDTPLGRLADKELRQAKQRAHASFDPLWQAKMHRAKITKGHARAKGYKWLAEQLGVPPPECHIGLFDVAQCERVVEVCRPYLRFGPDARSPPYS